MAYKSIVVVGSLNCDLVVQVERIPSLGETILGRDFKIHSGGKGANQAAEIGRLDHPVHMIGRVGSDAFGKQLLDSLEKVGVDTSPVAISPGPSGIAMIEVQQGGQNSIVVASGANASLSEFDLDENIALIRNASLVLAQLEIPISTLAHLTYLCKREGVALVLDPAPACTLSPQILRRVAWITPNETEAQFLSGTSFAPTNEIELQRVAEDLLKMGPRNVLLKLGENGSYIATEDGTRALVPAYSVAAVDTTAAGDAFNGAFAVALVREASPLGAARFAAAAAAISITRHGALPSMPSRSEVDAFMAAQQEVPQ